MSSSYATMVKEKKQRAAQSIVSKKPALYNTNHASVAAEKQASSSDAPQRQTRREKMLNNYVPPDIKVQMVHYFNFFAS